MAKIEEQLWTCLNRGGFILASTIAWTRASSIDILVQQFKDFNDHKTWKHLYRRGFRCVKCRILLEEQSNGKD